MKKKTISILCSLALLSVLGGCRQETASQDNVSQTGSQTESENDTEAGKDPEVSAEDAVSSPEASPEATDAPADTGNETGDDASGTDVSADSQTGASALSLSADPSSAVPQSVLEWGGLTLTADYWDPDTLTVHFSAENSSDSPLTIQVVSCWVNDAMQTPDFSLSVDAGQSAQGSMSFSQEDFSNSGISQAGTIGFTPVVLNGTDYTTLYTGQPVSLDTGLSGDPSVPDGQLLADQDGIRISFTGTTDNSMLGTDFLLCIENHSGGDLTFEAADTLVNGAAVNPLFSATVTDGKYAVSPLSLFSDELEDLQINEIQSLTFSIRVLDPTDYHTIRTLENLTPSVF